ncbi:septal ring lytic transglycosylase RlpA family protein [Conservatibacter flavescens]|nr:septal ring lytic transglycosylase RlpA family protein [Conservatibacter flavescens]
MNYKKILTVLFGVFVCFSSFYAQAETKKLYGIEGAKLNKATSKAKVYTYKVNGVAYTTKSHEKSKNYMKEGIASYYHTKFNGRKTANGEIYNPAKFTAAHKTLPINSYALVTNLRNNRKVIVRINDRGPFSNKRLIDLSKAAAAELGMVKAGLAKVRIEALHVDKAGRVSGAGVKTLAKTAKNTSKLVLTDTQPTKVATTPAQQVQANVKNTKVMTAEKNAQENGPYSVRMKNVKSRTEAEELVDKLAMRNVKTEILNNGKNYEVLFHAINSQADVNQLKQKMHQIDKKQSIQIYTYNY